MALRTLEFDVDDNGHARALIGKLKKFQKKALKDIEKSVDVYALEFRDEVRKNAQGRPGPRRITGGYWNSIKVVSSSTGMFRKSFQKSVMSDHPAGPSLERGKVLVDSMGRHYNQPPYPHWGPAILTVGPRWLNSFQNKLPEWWK